MKLKVTPELATLIKTLRMQNNISAKDLASHMGKSPSYLSKLEGGTVKCIQKTDLTDILTFISEGKDFFDEILPNAVRVLQSFMEPERIIAQPWLMQYDVIERKVAVPNEMVADIKRRMKELHTNISEIVEYINENFDSEMSTAFPANEVVEMDYQGTKRLLIRAQVSEKEMEKIFDLQDTFTDYIIINYLIYIIFRFEVFGKEKRKMPPEKASEVLRYMDVYMEQYEIRSLTGFMHIISSDEFIERQMPTVSIFQSANTVLMNEIVEFFKEAETRNALNTTKVLKNFHEMIMWDPAFTLKILGLPFAELEELSFQQKKKLIEEISELLDKYDKLSELEKKWENY